MVTGPAGAADPVEPSVGVLLPQAATKDSETAAAMVPAPRAVRGVMSDSAF